MITLLQKLFGTVTEAQQSLLNAVDGLQDWFYCVIYDLVSGYIDLLGIIIQQFFNYNGVVGPFSVIQNVFIAIACMAMMVIILYRIIQNLFDVAGGDSEYVPISALITRLVKSNIMIIIIPFVMKIGIKSVSMIANLMAYTMGGSLATFLENYVNNICTLFGITNATNPCRITIMSFYTITAIGFTLFFFKCCKYQVDLLIMDVFIVWAAVSQCTDDKTFYHTFVKSFVNICVTMVVHLLLFAGVIYAMSSTSQINTMIYVGCLICMFSPPELIKNFGKAESGIKRAAGGIITVASQFFVKM